MIHTRDASAFKACLGGRESGSGDDHSGVGVRRHVEVFRELGAAVVGGFRDGQHGADIGCQAAALGLDYAVDRNVLALIIDGHADDTADVVRCLGSVRGAGESDGADQQAGGGRTIGEAVLRGGKDGGFAHGGSG